MSTKCSIFSGDKPKNVHVFWECLDDDNIYLELENPDYFHVETFKIKEETITQVTLAIPGVIWNQIVKHGKQKSWGGEKFEKPLTPKQRSKKYSDNMKIVTKKLAKAANEYKQNG